MLGFGEAREIPQLVSKVMERAQYKAICGNKRAGLIGTREKSYNRMLVRSCCAQLGIPGTGVGSGTWSVIQGLEWLPGLTHCLPSCSRFLPLVPYCYCDSVILSAAACRNPGIRLLELEFWLIICMTLGTLSNFSWPRCSVLKYGNTHCVYLTNL